jgi:hypothetical protein
LHCPGGFVVPYAVLTCVYPYSTVLPDWGFVDPDPIHYWGSLLTCTRTQWRATRCYLRWFGKAHALKIKLLTSVNFSQKDITANIFYMSWDSTIITNVSLSCLYVV